VEILLWLVPPVVVTVLAMVWAGWVGRERREVDRDEAVRRMGVALDKDALTVRGTPAPRERSTGVAVRKSVVEQPVSASVVETSPADPDDGRAASAGERRRDLAS
jgi:hypothetical protein